MRSRLFSALALLLLVALPTFAVDRVIQNGVDMWRTVGDGTTFMDFSKDPIPAGFFCPNSAPFKGRVAFRGVPVITSEKGSKADTIVQRLDDAVFNKKGVAVTRVQMRALQFESTRPIKTSCGAFKIEARLSGEQPITNMRIIRDNENGGRYLAAIAVNAKLIFTPVGRPVSETLEIVWNVRFPANQEHQWSEKSLWGKGKFPGFILVDTDGDRVSDTYLPGRSSNFFAGVSSDGREIAPCHAGGHQHCLVVVLPED